LWGKAVAVKILKQVATAESMSRLTQAMGWKVKNHFFVIYLFIDFN